MYGKRFKAQCRLVFSKGRLLVLKNSFSSSKMIPICWIQSPWSTRLASAAARQSSEVGKNFCQNVGKDFWCCFNPVFIKNFPPPFWGSNYLQTVVIQNCKLGVYKNTFEHQLNASKLSANTTKVHLKSTHTQNI